MLTAYLTLALVVTIVLLFNNVDGPRAMLWGIAWPAFFWRLVRLETRSPSARPRARAADEITRPGWRR